MDGVEYILENMSLPNLYQFKNEKLFIEMKLLDKNIYFRFNKFFAVLQCILRRVS